MWALQAESPIPLYHQLEQVIKSQIAAGHWKPGEMIASERELMQMAKVSRATVRQAITSLIHQSILEREHGRGTFVSRPKFEQALHNVYSFSEQIAALGLHLQDRILQRKIIMARSDISEILGIPIGEKLIHLQRIRLLEGVPLMVSSSYIPYGLCPDLLTEEIGPSLYRLLTGKYDLPPLRSRDALECILADGAMAYHLQIPQGSPLMYTERVAYTHNDLPLHVGRNHIRGDMCRFRIDLGTDPSPIELKPPTKAKEVSS